MLLLKPGKIEKITKRERKGKCKKKDQEDKKNWKKSAL